METVFTFLTGSIQQGGSMSQFAFSSTSISRDGEEYFSSRNVLYLEKKRREAQLVSAKRWTPARVTNPGDPPNRRKRST
jgi:hypothetical protein